MSDVQYHQPVEGIKTIEIARACEGCNATKALASASYIAPQAKSPLQKSQETSIG